MDYDITGDDVQNIISLISSIMYIWDQDEDLDKAQKLIVQALDELSENPPLARRFSEKALAYISKCKKNKKIHQATINWLKCVATLIITADRIDSASPGTNKSEIESNFKKCYNYLKAIDSIEVGPFTAYPSDIENIKSQCEGTYLFIQSLEEEWRKRCEQEAKRKAAEEEAKRRAAKEEAKRKAAEEDSKRRADVESKGGCLKWLLRMLVVIGIGVAIFYTLKNCSSNNDDDTNFIINNVMADKMPYVYNGNEYLPIHVDCKIKNHKDSKYELSAQLFDLDKSPLKSEDGSYVEDSKNLEAVYDTTSWSDLKFYFNSYFAPSRGYVQLCLKDRENDNKTVSMTQLIEYDYSPSFQINGVIIDEIPYEYEGYYFLHIRINFTISNHQNSGYILTTKLYDQNKMPYIKKDGSYVEDSKNIQTRYDPSIWEDVQFFFNTNDISNGGYARIFIKDLQNNNNTVFSSDFIKYYLP